MAKNETGIYIVIKAWLPTGKTLDEQLASLTLVKTAHATGDYAPLLAEAKIDSVATDSKTRRVDETTEPEPTPELADGSEQPRQETSQDGDSSDNTQPGPDITEDAKAGKKKAA